MMTSVVPPPMSMRAAADLALVGREHRGGAGQGLEHHLGHVQVHALGALDDVLDRVAGRGHQVAAGLEAHAAHADGLGDAVVAVDDVLLGQHVQHLAVTRQRDGLGLLEHPLHVRLGDLAVGDGGHTFFVHARDVAARDAGVDRVDLHAGHGLGLLDGLLDGPNGGVDVDHDALLESRARDRPDADDVHSVVRLLGDDDADLGGPQIEPCNHLVVREHAVGHSRSAPV